MAKITLNYDLTCGENTCYKERGVHCQFLLTRRLGQEWCCGLFSENHHKYGFSPKTVDTLDGDEHGCLQRLPECIEAEKNTKES